MSETPGNLTAALDEIREREKAATPGPWWFDESDQCWRLHGVAFKIPAQRFADGELMIPEQVMNKQILKAPKNGTPYAEYWPEAADAEFITAARTDVPRLLALADALLELCTDWDGRAREIMDQVTGEDLIGAVAGFKAIGATGYEGRAKEVRELISRALLGEESNG